MFSRLVRLFYPRNSTRTILRGPLKKTRFVVIPGMGMTYALGGDHWNFGLFVKHVSPGDTVYDIGANCGQMTLLYSRLVGASGHVLSFEPAPENLSILRRNLQLNDCKNVEVHPVAVAAGEQPRKFCFDPVFHTFGAFASLGTALSQDSEIEVACVTLDATVKRGAPPPSVLKIDVEGAGGEVIEGALQVIEKFRPSIYMELHARSDDHPELVAIRMLKEKFGYHLFDILDRPITGVSTSTYNSAVWCKCPALDSGGRQNET